MQTFLKKLAIESGKRLLRYFRKVNQISSKGIAGIVTEADQASEAYILKQLSRFYPGCSIITEESGEYPGDRPLCWIIDPLDGTTNFAHGVPWFCVSIGVYEDGKPRMGAVYQPCSGELFFAERGKGARLNGKKICVSQGWAFQRALLATGLSQRGSGARFKKELQSFRRIEANVLGVRQFGAAALDLAMVACGRYEGFWQRGLSSWDVAAGLLLVEEAGGKVSNYSGQKAHIFEKEFVASNGKHHRKILRLIQGS